ncbi:MAG: RpoL/Rpb11 RNA polymerase subunit family protein [Candidatus Geothermarchaeales archaeon]
MRRGEDGQDIRALWEVALRRIDLEVEILSSDEKTLKFKIVGENHTLGNLIQDMLIRDERVKGAGFVRAHPLEQEIVFDVFLSKGEPMGVLRENVEKVKKYLDELREEVEKADTE